MPTKEELKAQYNISSDDFEVLTESPSDEEIQKKGFLIKLAEAFGVQPWMWKSPLGIVLAIIILPVAIQGAYNFWQPKAVYGAEQLLAYVETYEPLPPQHEIHWIAFYPQNIQPPQTKQLPTIVQLPTGSGIFPASATGQFA
jgi:hypothetical protein